MTKEQIKAYAVKQFPNDEFKQQIVIDAINWATKELQDKIADIKANCDLAIEGRDVKIIELEKQIEKMKCCANCKSFKGYGETCEGWGEPVLNLNCDCTEWQLKE